MSCNSMKRIILCLFGLLLMLGLFGADAAVRYLTLEELRQTPGPATVHVVARSGEPGEESVGSFTSKTTWQWEIKNRDGGFSDSGLFVDMKQYEAMTLSERGIVLNHKECDLTLDISATGAWKVVKISGVSRPLSKDDIRPIILAALGIAAVTGLSLLIRSVRNKAGTRASDQYIQKTKILAVNGVQYTTHKGIVSNAVVGHMAAGDTGALIGVLCSEQVHTDNEFTFLVCYNGGKKGNKKEVETVRQSSKRFNVLVSKLE